MKFKVASAILLLMAIASVATMIYVSVNGFPFAGSVGYAVIFIAVPAVAAYGVWKRTLWGVLVGLAFFLPQCINHVSATSSFKFMAPVSLGITSGAPGQGTAYIFNLLAIFMVVYMLVLLWQMRANPLISRSKGTP